MLKGGGGADFGALRAPKSSGRQRGRGVWQAAPAWPGCTRPAAFGRKRRRAGSGSSPGLHF